jgi:hypothetical protein
MVDRGMSVSLGESILPVLTLDPTSGFFPQEIQCSLRRFGHVAVIELPSSILLHEGMWTAGCSCDSWTLHLPGMVVPFRLLYLCSGVPQDVMYVLGRQM